MNAPIWKCSLPGTNRAPGMLSGEVVRTVPGKTPQLWPLSIDLAIAEKFVAQSPSRPQFLMDMKFMYWVLPMEMAEVGITPVSCGARWMLLTTCLESPGAHNGEPEYLSLGTPSATLIPLDRSRSWLRNRVLYRHC